MVSWRSTSTPAAPVSTNIGAVDVSRPLARTIGTPLCEDRFCSLDLTLTGDRGPGTAPLLVRCHDEATQAREICARVLEASAWRNVSNTFGRKPASMPIPVSCTDTRSSIWSGSVGSSESS